MLVASTVPPSSGTQKNILKLPLQLTDSTHGCFQPVTCVCKLGSSNYQNASATAKYIAIGEFSISEGQKNSATSQGFVMHATIPWWSNVYSFSGLWHRYYVGTSFLVRIFIYCIWLWSPCGWEAYTVRLQYFIEYISIILCGMFHFQSFLDQCMKFGGAWCFKHNDFEWLMSGIVSQSNTVRMSLYKLHRLKGTSRLWEVCRAEPYLRLVLQTITYIITITSLTPIILWTPKPLQESGTCCAAMCIGFYVCRQPQRFHQLHRSVCMYVTSMDGFPQITSCYHPPHEILET